MQRLYETNNENQLKAPSKNPQDTTSPTPTAKHYSEYTFECDEGLVRFGFTL